MVGAIIVMAGNASRMQMDKNKALLPINDKPLFWYSYALFKKLGFEICLVIRECDEVIVKKYVDDDTKIAYGGKTRSESVYNGLNAISSDKVIIHDAARIFIDDETTLKLVEKIKPGFGVFVGIKAIDTIRINDNGIYKTLDRDALVYAQTPQGAMTSDLKNAYEIEKARGFLATDEMMIMENAFYKVEMVLGSANNFKITTKKDYILAKELMKND